MARGCSKLSLIWRTQVVPTVAQPRLSRLPPRPPRRACSPAASGDPASSPLPAFGGKWAGSLGGLGLIRASTSLSLIAIVSRRGLSNTNQRLSRERERERERESDLFAKVSLDRWGFRLGFVYHSPRAAGSGLYHCVSILYHLTTARGLGSGDMTRL